jgi:putative transposase
MATLAELRNRGVEDVCIIACDGLKGLPEAIGEIWPRATVQICVVHLARVSERQVPAGLPQVRSLPE